MNTLTSQTRYLIGLLIVICLVAGILAIKKQFEPTMVVLPDAPVRSEMDVAESWRADVARTLSEFDQNQDARAAEQSLLALRVVDRDRELHLKFVLAFHALGESRPEGKSDLSEARRLFASSASVIR